MKKNLIQWVINRERKKFSNYKRNKKCKIFQSKNVFL